MLIPSDPNDEKDTIVEIRAGVGGDEAAIFAGDLFKMYERFIAQKGWKSEVMDVSPSDAGGFKTIEFKVTGDKVYSVMKYESGVHRVQRVPKTESQGRIQTSTATVAVLPEADEIDIQIDPRAAHRHLPRLRPWWPVRQHDLLGRAHHAPADRHGRAVAGPEVPDPEP